MLSETITSCYHCGDECRERIVEDSRTFCCDGCRLVYHILQSNNLCTYYRLENAPGQKGKTTDPGKFAFLDEKKITEALITFRNNTNTHITFFIPGIHCSSCIWLLENLNRINIGIVYSRIDFLRKEVFIEFKHDETSLRKIAEQLTSIGYEPAINLDSEERKKNKTPDRTRIYRIGVAGFCFGNIMMLSLPEYFSGGAISEPGLRPFFSYLNFLLALPVFFYSSMEFFISAWKGLKQKLVSIDVPVSIGIIAMFARSAYEIISQTGPGYFDSMTGLVFFMLIGRKFQEYTFNSLSFDHNYKSFFPIAVTVIKNGSEIPVAANDLAPGDTFQIRNGEIIPADSILTTGSSFIDYSFVTGESETIAIDAGAVVYAGGKHNGGLIELQALKRVSQSRLTSLWNKNTAANEKNQFKKTVTKISIWFIAVTLLIAAVAGLYWIGADAARAINAFTTVLVIACPCALALSAPFTFGNLLRFLSKRKIYIKDGHSIEKLADVDTVVFDKTGTLTQSGVQSVTWHGKALGQLQEQMIFSLSRQSSHPLSRRIASLYEKSQSLEVTGFKETAGQGISGIINGMEVRLGKSSFAGTAAISGTDTRVCLRIGNDDYGYYKIGNIYRAGTKDLINKLKELKLRLVVLTGDGDHEKENLQDFFGADAALNFNQSPQDKLNYIKDLQLQGRKVLMVGDGLNDAGALLQSDVGISVSDNINNFTPASNAIVASTMYTFIPHIILLSRSALRIIIWSFIISLLYNFVGLSFAVQGTLSPVIAAILMPISTVSLVLFAVAASSFKGRKLFRKQGATDKYQLSA